MVEKVSKDAGGYAAGKYYIPGVALKFGEHPVEAGHRILTEELEVEDREIKSAIRYSLTNRIPTGKVIGKGKTRHLAIKYKMLTINLKTYKVIEI